MADPLADLSTPESVLQEAARRLTLTLDDGTVAGAFYSGLASEVLTNLQAELPSPGTIKPTLPPEPEPPPKPPAPPAPPDPSKPPVLPPVESEPLLPVTFTERLEWARRRLRR